MNQGCLLHLFLQEIGCGNKAPPLATFEALPRSGFEEGEHASMLSRGYLQSYLTQGLGTLIWGSELLGSLRKMGGKAVAYPG